MGFFGNVGEWIKNRRADARKKKELVALDHLRRELEAQKNRLGPIIAIVGKMEAEVNNGDFEAAEKFVPDLAQRMKDKGVLDKAEKGAFKKFKRTLLKDLKAHMKGLR